MTKNRLTPRTVMPWLLIALALVLAMALGGLLGSCSSSAPSATPTPTKTPRPAEASPTLMPTPEIPSEPSTGVDASVPSGGTTDPQAQSANPAGGLATTGPTEPPSATPEPSATPVRPTSTPLAMAPTPVASSNSLMSSPDSGVQAFLWWQADAADRDIGLIKDGGFRWVKQYFAWQDVEGAGQGKYDWTNADRLVADVEKYGLKLIVRVGADPDRAFWAGNPPENTGTFSTFLSALATRYRGRIHAYQIWNEPNLAREWGGKRPDPAAYARMLRTSYGTIKAIDPNALVITAGMAPTTQDNDQATPDLRYYQGMYDAMGGQSNGFFDMLGAHGTGWAVDPETDPDVVVGTKRLHNNDPSAEDLLRVYAFRHVEDVRALMVKNGDADKRIAILEFGWTTDPRPDSPYYWHGAGAGITEMSQGEYLVRAFKYAAANWQPWIALMNVIYMPDIKWTKNDEQYWWSIIGPGYPDLYLRAGYVDLCIYLNGLDGTKCKYDPNQ